MNSALTLLDNSMVLFCSSILTGNHDATQLPVVLLGGGGGRIKGGRVLTYNEKPERQMCRLYLSMMDKMQVRMAKFGDATRAFEDHNQPTAGESAPGKPKSIIQPFG